MHKMNWPNMAPWKRRGRPTDSVPGKGSVSRRAVLHRRMLKPNRKPVEAAAVGLLLLGVLAWPQSASAGVNDVPKQVREGIEHYEAGRFDEASAAFDAASKKQPKDMRVTFDMACAKAAAGATDEAVQLFQQAAVTPDAKLAAKCHYNLGRLAADRAKAALGERPEAAEEAARGQARELAAAAIAHWRDCLAMEPKHPEARYNLELTELWRNRMNRVWKEADRQKRLAKMKLPEMLGWLEGEQAGLRGATRGLDGREPSPMHRLAVHQTAGTQRDLLEDIEPLKQKIAEAVNQPQTVQGGPGAAGPMGSASPMGAAPGMTAMPGGTCSSPGGCPSSGSEFAGMDPKQREHAIKVLSQLADRAGESMRTAAEHLAEQSPGEATKVQAGAIEQIDEINTVVTPYQGLVHRAVDRQKQLVGESKGPAEAPQDVATEPSDEASGAPVDAVDEAAEPVAPDPGEAAWRQRFVERWVPIMVAKAKQGLANMPPEEPEAPVEDKKPEDEAKESAGPGAGGVGPALNAPGTIDPQDVGQIKQPEQVDPQEAARKQREALRKSMKLAVELGPEVQRLVARAAADLDGDRVDEALPKQEQALKLLEKIAEPLKQPNQNQQNQDQQNQDQKNQDKQDQKKNQDKKNKDQKNQDDKENQDKKDQKQGKDDEKDNKDKQPKGDKKDEKDKKKPEDDKKDQQKQSQGQQPKDQRREQGKAQRQPRELSKQQAEALLQKVRQRDREKEKARKALIEAISRPPKAEKDW